MHFSKRYLKELDMILLLVFPLFATVYSLITKSSYFTSTVLFFVVPAVYYSIRTPEAIKKVTAFVAIFYIPIGVISDFIFEYANAWTIPNSVIKYRVFGVIPFENFLWGIGSAYLCLMLYEHFIDKSRHKFNKKKSTLFVSIAFAVFSLFVYFVTKDRDIFLINYPYLWVGLVVLLIPTIMYLFEFPLLISKFVKIAAYFFCIATLNEFTALTLGHWQFTGQKYIGTLPFFGFTIPLEEFLFYFIIMSLAVLSYFEFFFDDNK